MIGVLGEYLWRILEEARARPLYIVERTLGMPASATAGCLPSSALTNPLRLPDFIIGGAPRSGTTWLYDLLNRHPDLYMARPKQPEPKFFLVDHFYAQGLVHYSQTWFAGALANQVAGEKSTDYLESAAAAERIARDLPAVKLVFILREPAARAWSNYLWSQMNGLETEDFETALRLEDERERTLSERLRFARPFSYIRAAGTRICCDRTSIAFHASSC